MKVLHSFKQLGEELRKDGERIHRAQLRAAQKTALAAVKELVRNAPVAFGELRDSFDWRANRDGAEVSTDSPHAIPVDRGARAHWVPIAALIAWVKLKGGYGVSRTKAHRRISGAAQVAAMIAAHERKGAVPIDAPYAVAKAIQASIATKGTKPTHFIAKSMPAIDAALAANLDRELEKASKES